MKYAVLLERGRTLARPAVFLRPRGARLAGLWGGPGIVLPTRVEVVHRCSVDLRFVPSLGLRGVLSVYVDDDRGGVAVHDPDAKLPARRDRASRALYAHDAEVLPFVDDIETGDDEPDARAVARYEREQQNGHPLYTSGVSIMLGGFPMLWPEDDETREKRGQRLVLWTFEDAEPWIEVWRARSRFHVVQRNT